MNIYKIKQLDFNNLVRIYDGFIFYRIDENGNYLIMPLKSVDEFIKNYSIT